MSKIRAFALIGSLTAWGAAAPGCDDGGKDKDAGADATLDPDMIETADETAAGDLPPEGAEEPGAESQDPQPDDGAGNDLVPETPGDVPAEEIASITCDDLAEGWNRNLVVDGLARDFMLNLPSGVDDGGPWPVVFNFHGMGDTAENMSHLLSGAVGSEPMSFILVTPEDTNFALAGGLMVIDWDVAVVTETNREARLFDEILACLEEKYGVDEDRVHAVGFSMGGFVVDMLGTVRGDEIASAVTFSGAYGNDAANITGLLASLVSWPPYETANKYAQVFLHGGAADAYSLVVQTIYFEQMAANDVAMLGAAGHDAVLCNHGGGHSVPADFRAAQIIEFFHSHPLGTVESPFAAALPADYPDYCSFRASTE